ncbi:MAG: hypothetical protein ACI3YC_07480 [Alloprevotella sp.]
MNDTTSIGRSTVTPLTTDSVFVTEDWTTPYKKGMRDVDEYNRRGKKSVATETADTLSPYEQGYAEGYEDGLYTSRIVRFYAPRPGVYVSSPFYWDYYDYAYDPWYYGYGSWAFGYHWDGWWGWGSWYGYRPYYSWGWYDPFWCPPYHHHYWTAVPATGPTYRYGNSHRPFSPTASRPSRYATAARPSRDASASRNGLGFTRSARPSQRSTSTTSPSKTTSPSRSTRWNSERTTQPSTRSYDNGGSRSNMGGSFRSSGFTGGSRGGFTGGARGGRR